MKEFLEKIERALNNPTYSYSYNNVVVACEQVSKNKRLTDEQKKELDNFKERLKKVKYMSSYTGKINYSISYRDFANVANDLCDYIEGLE